MLPGDAEERPLEDDDDDDQVMKEPAGEVERRAGGPAVEIQLSRARYRTPGINSRSGPDRTRHQETFGSCGCELGITMTTTEIIRSTK